jgi:hypothetical protein
MAILRRGEAVEDVEAGGEVVSAPRRPIFIARGEWAGFDVPISHSRYHLFPHDRYLLILVGMRVVEGQEARSA